MLKAEHAPSGTIYEAKQFGALPNVQRQVLKPAMVCLACRTRAHFRGAARNGRAESFFCRPHPSSCDLSTVKETEVDDPDATVVADRIVNTADIIEVDFTLPPAATVEATGAGRPPRHGGLDRVAKRHIGQERRTDTRHQRLRAILRYLLTDPEFATSDQRFTVSGMITLPASEFFVHFSVATPESHKDLYRAYWGMIDHVRQWNEEWYLNSGSMGSVGVHLTPEQAQSMIARVPAGNLYNLTGHAALAVGRYFRGRGSPTIELDDPRHIVVALP